MNQNDFRRMLDSTDRNPEVAQAPSHVSVAAPANVAKPPKEKQKNFKPRIVKKYVLL
jgi:hypothetical protein